MRQLFKKLKEGLLGHIPYILINVLLFSLLWIISVFACLKSSIWIVRYLNALVCCCVVIFVSVTVQIFCMGRSLSIAAY